MSARDTVARLLRDGGLDLPTPGSGRTRERHMRLFEIARRYPVSVARLVEAHTDAVAILREARRDPEPGAVYGVWASSGPSGGPSIGHRVSAHAESTATDLVVNGTMAFASGLGCVRRALVTAGYDASRPAPPSDIGQVLLDIDVRASSTVAMNTDGWSTVALSAAATGSVTFRDKPVGRSDIVGTPGWYLDRVGFWHGACGPAACWAGAAAGLVDAAEYLVDDNPHRRSHLGALRSDLWALEAVLATAGDEIDDRPDEANAAHRRALALRHHVERTVADILDRFGRAFGPRPFAYDPDLNQRWLDTHLYTRQDHAERDLEALGSILRPATAP